MCLDYQWRATSPENYAQELVIDDYHALISIGHSYNAVQHLLHVNEYGETML